MILGIGKKATDKDKAKTTDAKGVAKAPSQIKAQGAKAQGTKAQEQKPTKAATKSDAKKPQAKKPEKVEATAKDYGILISPIITEKSTMLAQHNQVAFKVATTASKPAIKQAVERIFSVEVKAVNALNQTGKLKSVRGIKGKRSDFKKAVVTLAQGNSIDLGTEI